MAFPGIAEQFADLESGKALAQLLEAGDGE